MFPFSLFLARFTISCQPNIFFTFTKQTKTPHKSKTSISFRWTAGACHGNNRKEMNRAMIRQLPEQFGRLYDTIDNI